MKSVYVAIILIMGLITIQSCDKADINPNLKDFCKVKPSDWECEIVESDFNMAEIPRNADTPVAIVKYTNPKETFEGIGQIQLPSSLILDLYPIHKKQELIDFIVSQQIYSWCIPTYYGETEDYFIITSPCFVNAGTYTEDANSCMKELYTALDKIIIKKDYGFIGD